jgi:hypothetical protein
VDKENRKNIFRKVSIKDIMNVVNDDTSGNNVNSVYMRTGVLLSQNKWESDWGSIGGRTISGNTYGYRSTTNSRAGFPMV